MKHVLVLIIAFLGCHLLAQDWDTSKLDDSIIISIDGNLSAGDKFKILLSPLTEQPCEPATQLTSFTSKVKNAKQKFNNLPSTYVLAQIQNGSKREKFLMEIMESMASMAGQRTLFTVSVNKTEQILDFHKDNEMIKIELLSFYDLKNKQVIDTKIEDYFDIYSNSWNLTELKSSLLKAKSTCLDLSL